MYLDDEARRHEIGKVHDRKQTKSSFNPSHESSSVMTCPVQGGPTEDPLTSIFKIPFTKDTSTDLTRTKIQGTQLDRHRSGATGSLFCLNLLSSNTFNNGREASVPRTAQAAATIASSDSQALLCAQFFVVACLCVMRQQLLRTKHEISKGTVIPARSRRREQPC